MTLKIDRTGCITIPKPLRDQFGWRAGSHVETVETPEGLLLKTAQPPLKPVPQPADESHADRMRKAWGL
jgi:AbrB family looped-hinge helix DNA binding protein